MRKYLLLLSLLCLLSANSFAFRFIQITDNHAGRHGPGNTMTERIVEEILSLDPRPDFIVHTGDVTETGLDWEYEKYLQLISPLGQAQIPIYHVPGNHDTRWAARLLEDFSVLGPPYSHFSFQGHHFILLNTSLVPQAHGHLDQAQLTWLQHFLEGLDPATPLWVFGHHPLGFTPAFMDNHWEATTRLAPYNLILGMFGHGHSTRRWQVDGKEYYLSKAALSGCYTIVDVKEDQALIYTKELGGPQTLLFTVPITQPEKKEFAFQVASPEKLVAGKEFTVTVSSSQKATFQAKLGSGPWQKFSENKCNLTPAFPGKQTLWVRTKDEQGLYQQEFSLDVAPGPASRILWTFPTGDAIMAAPCTDEKQVYVPSTDGNLYSIDKATGKENWRFATGGAILTTPQLHKGKLYVGSGDGHVYAIDTTGKLLWQNSLGEPTISSPAISDNKLFLGGPGALFCLSLSTGQLLWKFPTGGLVKVKPLATANRVYFTSWDGHAYCLESESGKLLWQRKIDSSFYYAPATGNPALGQVLVLTTPRNLVIALDPLTGEEKWRASNIKAGYCSPSLAADSVLVTTLDGIVAALDPATGIRKWSLSTGQTIYDAQVAVEGNLAVTNTLNGGLVILEPETGKLLEKIKLSFGYFFSAPILDRGIAYVGGTDGQLYAVQAD